jgi:iron complex outermembrane recepter protein
MFSRTKICTALLAALAANAWAQETTSAQRVEITGSAIRRVESEGALPVTVISRDAIDKTGALSITELIQKLPAMTGGNFQQSASSVNGNGNGTTTAAIHGLDQKYTLVLLNGRRVAPFGGFGASGGDGSVNLESLPLDAIERVEVLTDGASALYGSDAIAGVVNFITKKNQTDGSISFNGTRPTQAGGSKWSAGISKGFGDIDKDGNNLLLSYSHDVQNKLMASQRAVSRRGGLIPVTIDGQAATLYQPSSNSLPANIYLDSGTRINPYLTANGNCGSNPVVFASGTRCFTNYAATVQDIPGSKRDSVFVTDHFKLNANTTLFAEALWSKFDMTAAFAPSAQPMGMGSEDLPGQPLDILWQKYVVPYQTQTGDTSTGASLHYRSFDAGGRTDDWQTLSHHYVLGAEGTAMDWDYTASLTLSSNTDQDRLAGGYLDFTKFVDLIKTGAYDPIVPIAGQSLASAELHGTFLKSKIAQDVLSLHASKDLFKMAGGTSSLALGFDATHQKMSQDTTLMSEFGNGTAAVAGATDYAVGGFYGYVPMSASRNNYGAFAELLMPIAKKTELTGSIRFDRYDRVKNDKPFTQDNANNLQPLSSESEGNSFSHPTFKLSFRSQPVEMLLLRGSFGTGFKAPSVNQIAAPLAFATNTSGSYPCPYPTTDVCIANGTDPEQWDLITVGNPQKGSAGLKAETSRQWTLGGRLEPAKGLSFGLDYWGVKLKNQILAGMPEGYAFAHADTLGNLFVNPYRDPSGPQTIGLLQKPFNAGSADYQGLDWEINLSSNTSFGRVSADLSGTHMLKADYELPGGKQTDLGRFGGDNNVVFRDIFRLTLGLQTGAFTNTLSVNYKSSYADQPFTADSGNVLAVNPDGSLGDGVAYNGRVSSYTLVDWQGRWDVSQNFRVTLGLNNIFNTKPPLSLKIVGGNQVGYDGRYADPTGRAIAVGASYRF